MFDLGTGYRLQNEITRAAAEGRLAAIRAEAGTVLWIVHTVAAVTAFIALALPSDSVLAVLGAKSEPLRNELAPVAPAVLALNCFTLPSLLGTRLAAGWQRHWLIGATQVFTTALTLAFAAGGLAAGISPAMFLVVATAIPIVINGALTFWLASQLPGTTNYWRPPRFAALRRSLQSGVAFFVPQFAGAMRFSAPPIIIATFLGGTAVTPFNLLQRLLSLLAQPQSWFLEPLWPAYADAATHADYHWLRRTLWLSVRATFVFTALPLLTALFWARPFIEWWTGTGAALIPSVFLFWMVLWHAGLALTHPFSYCLNGLGRMRGQMLYTPVTVVVGLGGMAAIVTFQGLTMAAAPFALVTILFHLPCVVLDVRSVACTWKRGPLPSASPGTARS